jgi:hypothetical protein
MRVDVRAKGTYAAATPAAVCANTLRQSLATRMRDVTYFIGSRAHVMRSKQLHARLSVFMSTYQYRGCSDISMLVGDAPLKNARVSWPFCRGSGQPATPAVRKVSGTRQNPVTIAGNASTLYDLFARLKGSSDAHKATARTLVRLRASQSIARVQWHQHVRRRRHFERCLRLD